MMISLTFYNHYYSLKTKMSKKGDIDEVYATVSLHCVERVISFTKVRKSNSMIEKMSQYTQRQKLNTK